MVNMVNMKTERIVIRCTPRTRRKWRILVARMGVDNYEDALIELMKKYEEYGELEKIPLV